MVLTQWGYDSSDRLAALTYPGGNGGEAGEQVSYAYGTHGLPVSAIGASTYVGGATYNALGQATERRLGSASGVVRQVYDYPAAKNYRLGTLKAGSNSPNYDNLQNIAYTYDVAGNAQSLADAAADGGAQTQSFTYDDLHRLVTAQATGGSYGAYTTRTYSYTPDSKLSAFEGAAYTYLDGAHKHAVTHLGGIQRYWYDLNGNATTRVSGTDTYALAYDAENRLQQVQKNGLLVATYTYDGDGNRVRSVTVAGGVTTTNVYIGEHYETNTTGGTATKKYYGLPGGGGRVALNNTGTLYYLLTDHLGSASVTTTSAGARSADIRYYPYGADRYKSTPQPSTYRYTGQFYDGTPGLYYYKARWYDQTIGLFLSPDTLVPDPGNPQSLNRYAYSLNNPVRYSDPSGHFSEEELLDKYKAFIGPNQLRSTRDNPETAYWYYLLRAAEVGDKLRFGGPDGDVTGQIIVEDGQLLVAGSDGQKYNIDWKGIGGIGSGIIPETSTLTKADGTTLWAESQLRRYVNGPHQLSDIDYVEATAGGYWGVGGHVSVKYDRYGNVHVGISGGIGIGKVGGSLEAGNLMQDSPPDPGQLSGAVDGWGIGVQGGYLFGAALSGVNTGPLPLQLGLSSPGVAMTVSYTWLVGGR